ncbi:MAG: hypothetical protein ACTHMY_02850 [Solirubrobacteraceae bacterium]
MAGLIAAMAALALVAAPTALANGDTITAAAGMQFSGVVDNGTSCTTPATATISWGDGSSSAGTVDSTNNTVSGTHTYSSSGTFSGTVTLTGTACGATPDTFTATVAPAPQFTECPPVGADFGCQFLIDVTSGGTTILQDTNQGPYENAEDALIGIKNDSSSPISSIPISVPGSDVFGFEQDGLCDPGFGPVPADCQQLTLDSGGTPAPGTPCDPTAGACATPQPPGQTAPDAGAYTGTTRNGYEGPGTFYTNVSTDTSSGTVNFSPAVPPGGSTYFSLEEPPSANALNVGSTPIGAGLTAPPTVTATSASFVAVVNPNGAATTAQFQFSLDPRYSALAAFTQTTALQSVGGDFADHVVSATVTGLVPNALYHVHLVANNKNGQTVGPDVTFQTKSGPTPGAPTLGRTFNIAPVSGLVLVKVNGVFIPLTELTQFPKNTEIDALNGTLRLITAAGGHAASDAAAKGKGKKGKSKGKTQTGTFGGAIFKVSQAHNGLATLTLVENAFAGAPSFATCKGKAADASAAASKTLQLLKASAKGKFSTKGKYAAATVRGTKWTTADRCNGTQVHVNSGAVAVTDFVRHKTIVLHGGQSYLAKKR